MPWTSYLPQLPSQLSTIENWLVTTGFVFAILSGLSGFVAVQIRGHRANLEKRQAEERLLDVQNNITSHNSALREELEEARKETAAIRERQKTRDVPVEKREDILKSLRRIKGKVQVGYINDPETQVFAARLKKILDEAGWETTEEGLMSFGAIVGLRLEVHDPTNLPPQARILKEALDVAFTDVAFRRNRNILDGDVWLTVGSKPAE